MKLLGLWKDSYAHGAGDASKRPQFSMVETKRAVGILRDVQPLDEGYVERMWDWIQANVR
jgi:hypothetical protein